jgi:hypothetical protein
MTPEDHAIRTAVATATRAAETRTATPVPDSLVTVTTLIGTEECPLRPCPDCTAGIACGVDCASCDGLGMLIPEVAR